MTCAPRRRLLSRRLCSRALPDWRPHGMGSRGGSTKTLILRSGEVVEWLKAPHSKCMRQIDPRPSWLPSLFSCADVDSKADNFRRSSLDLTVSQGSHPGELILSVTPGSLDFDVSPCYLCFELICGALIRPAQAEQHRADGQKAQSSANDLAVAKIARTKVETAVRVARLRVSGDFAGREAHRRRDLLRPLPNREGQQAQAGSASARPSGRRRHETRRRPR